MSVEKLSNDSKIDNEVVPYTQICNKVINHIKDGDSYLVWSYLRSKSQDWKVIKQNIKNTYGFSDKKIKQIFSYLKRCNLIAYEQKKCANGRFAQVDIKVLRGNLFDKNQPYKECATAGPKWGRAEKGSTRNDELLNKENTKERKIPIKNTWSSESDDRVDKKGIFFDDFWEVYPKRKHKEQARDIWIKKDCDKLVDKIIADIKVRSAKDAHWQVIKSIPYPENYLKKETWKDDITSISCKSQQSKGLGPYERMMADKNKSDLLSPKGKGNIYDGTHADVKRLN